MLLRVLIGLMLILLIPARTLANTILIAMDGSQANHLKAYGIAYWAIEQGVEVDWLLNYKGGSFMMDYYQKIENELIIRGVGYTVISDAEQNSILNEIADPSSNTDVMKLEKAPRIAVYSPKSALPWDDAVTLVLTYAEIPYDVIFDDELMYDELPMYDWLHLHHEDFTGQFGKFENAYANFPWYRRQKMEFMESARKHGFSKVSDLKLAVVKKIESYVAGGGFLFAMCSATDTYDIALAAEGVDIVGTVYDGDPPDPDAQRRLDYSKTFAFKDFRLRMNPMEYEYSDIDNQPNARGLTQNNDFFTLFEFSAKWDPIPTMLTQNHEKIIRGFMGQTTAYKKKLLKSDVLVMGETNGLDEAKYIHGIFGKGFWTFFGGHDPEDYQHRVGEEPTDLNLHPNSAGYRLILNNILFPAAKKKKQKT
jgi:hypothetical protein